MAECSVCCSIHVPNPSTEKWKSNGCVTCIDLIWTNGHVMLFAEPLITCSNTGFILAYHPPLEVGQIKSTLTQSAEYHKSAYLWINICCSSWEWLLYMCLKTNNLADAYNMTKTKTSPGFRFICCFILDRIIKDWLKCLSFRCTRQKRWCHLFPPVSGFTWTLHSPYTHTHTPLCMLYVLPLIVHTYCMLYVPALNLNPYSMLYVLALNVLTYCM